MALAVDCVRECCVGGCCAALDVVMPMPSCFLCDAGMERKDLLAKNVNIFKVPSSLPHSLFLKVINL